jgi:hypothetical protein
MRCQLYTDGLVKRDRNPKQNQKSKEQLKWFVGVFKQIAAVTSIPLI